MASTKDSNWIYLKVKLLFCLDNKFWPGFLVGLFYFGWIFRWFWYLYPLDSLGVESEIAAAMILALVFSICIVTMSLWWGVASYLGYKFVKKGVPVSLIPPVLAGIFTLTEYLRPISLSIISYGSGGTIGPYWPIGNLAYFFIDIKILASSAFWWGIYGIEFWLIFFISSLFLLIFKKNYRKIAAIEFSVAIFILVILGIYSSFLINNFEQTSPIPISLIQTNLNSSDLDTEEQALKDLQLKLQALEEVAVKNPGGIIVFPEGTNFSKSLIQFLDTEGMARYFNNLSSQELLILDSIRVWEDNRYKSKAVLISSHNGIIGSYDKQILTPGGEFLPYVISYPLGLIRPSLKEDFASYREYDKGYGSNIISYGGNKIGILICSELKSPLKARESNPDFIATISSYSMWKGNLAVVGEDKISSRFRAIENGKYVFLASNYGQSYIINTAGDIVKITSPNTHELLTGHIIPNKGRTWYNYVGDWPILLVSSAFFGLALKKYRNGTKS